MWHLNGISVDQFESVQFSLRNSVAGELRITRAVAGDAAAFLRDGGDVVLTDDAGRVQFRGKVSRPRAGRETGTQARQMVAVADGWRKLERTTYLEDYPFDSAEGTPDTRVLIGGRYQKVNVTDPNAEDEGAFEQVIDIVPENVGTTLAKVARFIGQTNPEILVGGIIPPQQADGTSCAAIVRAVCRFFPGSVAWVDPADGRLHIRPASALEPLTIAATGPDVETWDVVERNDLVLPGAQLNVRKVRQSPGGAIEDLFVYTAGNPSAEGALVQPLELQPEVHALQIAYMEIGSIADVKITDLDWWAKFVPWVAAAMNGESDYEVLAIVSPALQRPSGIIFADDFENVIVRGGPLESFLLYGCDGPYGRREQLVTVAAPYTKARLTRSSANCKMIVSRQLGGGRAIQYEVEVSVPLAFTNLVGTGRYAWEDVVALDPGEDPADYSHLADLFFRETRTLGYAGSITIVTDAPPASLIGRALNLTGLDPAWAGMNAPIHAVDYDVKSGRATLTFGAAEYLGLAELADLLRALQHKRPLRRRSTRFGLPPEPNLSASQGDGAPVPPPQPGEPGQTAPPAEPPGRLKATITPEGAVSAGATYSAVREGGASVGPFQSDEEADVEGGRYTVHFAAVSGFVPPAKIENVRVFSGMLETLDEKKCVYTALGVGGLPFATETRAKKGSPGDYEWRVVPESRLFTSLSPEVSEIEITGLDEWTTLSEDLKVFLEGTIDSDGSLTVAAIKSTSGVWPDRLVYAGTPRLQAKFNREIAEIKFADKTPAVLPFTTTHLMCEPRCGDPVSVLFPFAY